VLLCKALPLNIVIIRLITVNNVLLCVGLLTYCKGTIKANRLYDINCVSDDNTLFYGICTLYILKCGAQKVMRKMLYNKFDMLLIMWNLFAKI